jgi:hypothetical protein
LDGCPDTRAVSIPNGVDFEYYETVRDKTVQNVQSVRIVRDDENNKKIKNIRTNEVVEQVKRSNKQGDRTNRVIEQFTQTKRLNKPTDRTNEVIEQAKRSNGANLLFMGAMDYFPNEDAVLYFSAEIWPHIKKQLPDTCFYVVGGNPSKKVRILSQKDRNITVTGHVPDVRPYLKRRTEQGS